MPAALLNVTRTVLDSRHDGARIPALTAHARGERRGGIVVIQEIFGLTDHIAEMCAFFADAGYDACAPALFERIEPNFHAELNAEGFAKGRAAATASPWPQVMGDVAAAIASLPKPCFITGFCYGGAVAWRAAGECEGLSGASAFYGRIIVDMLNIAPRIPILLHYGARDASIPMSDIERVRLAAPGADLFVYNEAGHGFCRKASADYHEPSRDLALARTLEVFKRISQGA